MLAVNGQISHPLTANYLIHDSAIFGQDATPVENSDMTFCSFNIQVFGTTKMKKVAVVEILLKILSQCDLTFIMEIRDASGSAIQDLLSKLNEYMQNKDHNGGKTRFEMSLSERLGRTASKEQYVAKAYFFNVDKIRVNSTYQYPSTFDQFERAPYSILIQAPSNSSHRLMLSGIHTSPKAAVREIDALYDVYQYYQSMKNLTQLMNNNWIVAGDFNAGCSYVKESDWKSIRLRTDTSKFEWLIDDETRTMVKTNCPYDRFVISKPFAFNIGQANVFNYASEWNIQKSLAEEVSDHFPIRVVVKNWNK